MKILTTDKEVHNKPSLVELISCIPSADGSLKLLVEKEIHNKNDVKEITEKLGQWILWPDQTEVIGVYFRPCLLEILGWSQKLIGKPSSPDFDERVHSAFCVCLSKLIYICDEAKKFILIYFKDAPPPFSAISIYADGKQPPAKKSKLSSTVFPTSEKEILEATFTFLKFYGSSEFPNWECSRLLVFLKHDNEEIRWLACNVLALLYRMSEQECRLFLEMYTSREFITIMSVKKKFLKSQSHMPKGSTIQCLSQENTFKIGKVHLPLYDKNMIMQDGLVKLSSTCENLESIALAISADSPILVEGVVGSGKTSLIEHLARITGRSKAPELSKIQLSDQTDSKTLIGTYKCTPNPGEFIWQAGSLTQAVMEGHWLLLEDIDFAPMEVISLLIPILESRMLPVPGHGNIRAHPNFQIFATRRILPAGCRMRIGSARLIENLFTKIVLKSLSPEEIKSLISLKWPDLSSIAEKLVEVYIALSYGQHGFQKSFEGCPQCSSKDLTSAKVSGRFVSLRDLMKWCLRMVSHINEKDLHLRAFEEALDCFCAAVPDVSKRYIFALHIGSHLNMNEPTVHFYFYKYKPEIPDNSFTFFSVGSRGKIPRRKRSSFSLKGVSKAMFSKTRLSSCLLEKATVAVMNNEPILIVGETGTGKTSTIQYLAQQTNHSLNVINMNQQSDSSDLLGGFKPVEMRTVVAPLRQEFERLFSNTFSVKENSVFLSHIMTSFVNCNWKILFALMEETLKKGCKKLSKEDSKKSSTQKLVKKWGHFRLKLKTIKDQVEKVQSALAFSFIEGTLVKAVREGKWVLLDEINLASADTLECLSGLLESSTGSVTLHERGDSKPVVRHPEFRLFACMNPATDVGKKELPAGLRNRFTEFFMEEFQDKDDLMQLVQEYLQEHNPSPKLIAGIVSFYLKIREQALTNLTDGTGHKPHFSLRTLCRALLVAKQNPCKNFLRSLEEAFSLSFLTQLDRSSYPIVTALIDEKILFKKLVSSKKLKEGSKVMIPCPGKIEEFVNVEGYWVPKGDENPKKSEKYILTSSIRNNLRDLVRIVSIGKFPILLQGDTSVGKTSLISYLAQLTGNMCVRINNHQHTDLQEYVGSYSPDECGKLVFKEGVLVQAMRNGHWIILDELNLAPTDVLEALNRLLDDNRELFIPEIETIVKAHPMFMLFATQNPPGLYGGRQVLSRAFRNRFVELHFDMIPCKELADILHLRCDISLSHSEKMIRVLEDLQRMRRETNIFQGKQSFITLRDLFRWAERYRLAQHPDAKLYDWDQHIADEGYLVLAGRMRLEKEAEEIKQVLEKNLKRKVDPMKLFELSSETSPVTRPILEKLSLVKGFEHVVWTMDMRRLYVLVSKALSFCEPILLVGETGCGKTTVCQMIAAIKEQDLFTVNCHMHTEGADFLGGLRPVRDRISTNDNRLFEWVDGPLIQAMKLGGLFLADEISLADDSVLERLNSLLEPERILVLSEKGCSNQNENINRPDFVFAHDSFRLIGTMNPGGDYGKKELSPALRNRLTEIWCPKVEISRSEDDVQMIINHNLRSISLDCKDSIGRAMIAFLNCFSKSELGKKCTISIRDILSWVSFINKVMKTNPNLDIGLAYIHGAYLVLLDSLGSGATGSTVLNWRKIKISFCKYLCEQARKLTSRDLDITTLNENSVSSLCFIDNELCFGIEPFIIPKGPLMQKELLQFSFEAPRTCLNVLRILRGLQLSRPILLEGSPGVGKTSLVMALAKASGNDIIRINLSEQTDVSDLFGADLPEEGCEGGRFAWRDGPLLQALKSGSWVVLDELNLASQSVLEGLNACFDHRGEVFVPELNKTFEVKHNLTKIFACQNPQYQGGARKGLPKSFLNRFTQVYMEPLSSDDLTFILKMMHADIPLEIVSKMVKFNKTLVNEIQVRKSWGNSGGPWEFNLRDLFRWCEIMLKNKSSHGKMNPGEYVEVIYSDRMRKKEDKENVLNIYEKVFGNEYPLYRKSGLFFINDTKIQVGRSFIDKKINGDEARLQTHRELYIMHNQTQYLESVINCINMSWMTILVGDSGEGKTSLVHLLSDLTGRRLETLSVNSHMDVTELLGGFEQADYRRHLNELMDDFEYIIWREVRRYLLEQNLAVTSEILLAWNTIVDMKNIDKGLSTSEEVDLFLKTCTKIIDVIDFVTKKCPALDLLDLKNSFRKLTDKVSKAGTVSGGGIFEWVDSSLVKAVRNGYWLLIDGVNLCSPSVLDRLNGLLEPGGVLTINERGVIEGGIPTVEPHANFRIFLTMDPLHGEISRAMRNRGIEICMTGMWEDKLDVHALLLSRGLKDTNLQKLLTSAHFSIREALPGYERLPISYLGRSASLMKQLLQLGHTPFTALRQSLSQTYERNFGKANRSTVKDAIKDILSGVDKKSLKKSQLYYPLPCKFVLGAHAIHNDSLTAYPSQVVSLIENIEMSQNQKISDSISFSAPLPFELLSSSDCLMTSLFITLASASLKQWELFSSWAELGPLKKSVLPKVITSICNSPSATLVTLQEITDKRFPADPRFNRIVVDLDTVELNNMVSLSNKSLIGLWFNIRKEFRAHCNFKSKKMSKKTKKQRSILELSKDICTGTVSSKMCYHPSLKHIYPLLDHLSKFITALTSNIDISFTDIEYFVLREALLWMDRFENICQQTVAKEAFHLFLPQLVFHWQQLQDGLLSDIPASWHGIFPKELEDINNKLKNDFNSFSSPLHYIVPVLRTHLGYPLPFINKVVADFYVQVSQIAPTFVPFYDKIDDHSINYLLASEIGREAKCDLIDVMVESCGEDVDYAELSYKLQRIKECVSLRVSKSNFDRVKALSTIQVWPIIDLLVSKQLNFTEAKLACPKVHLQECKDALVKCSQILWECINSCDSSGKLAKVSLYLFDVNNCSVRRPSRWVFYEDSQRNVDNMDIRDSWKGEDTVVLSSKTCLLTYHLLTGFCKPDQEIEEITVGRHSEREKQLNSIRSTLFRNWDHFSDVNYSYDFSFKESVKKFVYDLFQSLAMTMNIKDYEQNVVDILKLLNVASTILEKHAELFGLEGTILLKLLNSYLSSVEDSNNIGNGIDLSKLGIYSGLLQSWLLSHIEPLDPAQQRNLMLSYHTNELEVLDDTLLLFKWVDLLRYNHSSDSRHPHTTVYEEKVEIIKSEIKTLSNVIAYRPEPPQYVEIAQKISDFINTVFLPSRILEMICSLDTCTGNKLNTILQQCEGTLLSCDNFIKNMFTSYLLYRDLYIPLLHGVSFTCECIRVMMVQCKLRDACLLSKLDLNASLTRMLSVPSKRINDNPSETLTEIILDQRLVTNFLSTQSTNKNYHMLSQSLLLRSNLYDLYNFATAEGCVSKNVFNHLTSLTEKVVAWWKEQEEEKKRKAEEDACLFKYKARTLAISETEDEEIEREYKELFPDFEEEFNDLDNMVLDGEMDVDKEKEEIIKTTDVSRFSDDNLQELIECYLQLSTSLASSSWLSPINDLKMMVVTPILLRLQLVQLLLRSVGPIMSDEIDGVLIGAFIISNHASSASIKETINYSLVKKPYNYYHDSVPEESLKIKPLLQVLEIRINELLETWPSHPTLLMIYKVIYRVLEFSITSPLIRFVIGLETILEKSHEWEKNAHKGVSLMEAISPITDQILAWRKMELNAWKSCLDMITYNVSMEANKYWPHLYELLTTIELEDVSKLIESLKQFMEKALIGDYERRLQLMFSFHCHLTLVSRYCINPLKKSVIDKLVCVTWNIHKFYGQFLPLVKETIANGMKPIEKQVKDFIKIMRWNDINFFAVKDSVIKSRRTLHRHMRKWEKILRQSSEPLLIDNKSGSELENTGEWDKNEVTTQTERISVNSPAFAEAHSVPGASENTLLLRLPSLTQKCFSFIKEILGNVCYVNNIEAMEEMSEEIIVTYQNLGNQTMKAEAVADKVNRMRQHKAIMHHKRECLATLLKSLNIIGVSYTKGNSIFKEDDRDKCLQVPPLDIKVCHRNNTNLENACFAWEKCDKYFFRCIGRHSLLFSSLNREVHADLSPELIKRLKGSSCHFLLLARKLRETIPILSVQTGEAISMVNEIKKACKIMFPDVKCIRDWWVKINSMVISLSLSLAEEKKLFEAYTNSEPLIVLLPAKSPISTLQVQEILTLMNEIRLELSKVSMTTSMNYQNYNQEMTYKLASEENVLELKSVIDKLSSISQKLENIVKILNVESHSTSALSQSLLMWINSWEFVESEFEDWSLELVPLVETTYSTSEKIETCITKMLLAIESLYKRYCQKQEISEKEEEADTKLMISEGVINSFLDDFNMLKLAEVNDSIFSLITELRENNNPSIIIALKEMLPLISLYISVCENLLTFGVGSSCSINKLLSVILAIYQQLTIRGFCRPQELEEQGQGEGATQFEDSGLGLTEGEGQKDVSDRFESEDQLESALQEGQKEQAGDKDVAEEEGGIEMSQDFEGNLQNMEREEEDDKKDDDNDSDDNDLDKEMGETEKGADKIDEKLWGEEEDDKKEEDAPEKEEEDEHGPGDGETTESELVAKEDNKNKKDVDKREEKKKKELEVMEEDRREADEENEEETYDDKYKDKLGGEDQIDNNEEEDQMDLPDNINLDGKENDEGSGDENDPDLNPEIEEKALFPEEAREQKEMDEHQDNDKEEVDDENKDDGADNEEPGEKEEELEDATEEDETRADKTRMDTENGEEEITPDNANDDATPSKDSEAKEEAQAAETNTQDASKDKTKDLPTTATGAQEEDEEFKQDEQGEVGEQTEDMTGVGQSDSKTREDSHKGKTSALTNEQQAEQKRDEENRPRKPGDVDNSKTLGDVEKEIHQGLMTKKQSGSKEEKEDKLEKETTVEMEPEGKDARMYEHVGMADDHYDKQAIDAGTQEEAKLRPAPLEEEEELEDKDEAQGIEDTLMDVDEPEEEVEVEETKKRIADMDEKEGPQSKRSRGDPEGEGKTDHLMETEGEIVKEMIIQRPLQNDFHTLSDDDDETKAEIVNEDLASVKEQIEEADDGDVQMGSDHWSGLEGKITPLALQLCEQLRLILEPTEASKLRGDFRTGKRLNMRKVIPYIASQFRKDKIWLRRTQPNKRSYQVILAVDDSESMKEMNAGELTRESVSLVAKALTLLEVGNVGVLSFGKDTKILHPLHKPFSDQAGAKVFANLKFDQTETNFAKMIKDSVALFGGSKEGRGTRPDVAQLLLIVSDGQTHKHLKAVKAAVRAAREARVFLVFLVIDAQETNSFYDTQVCEFVDNKVKLTSLSETFPFPYFLVVRDLHGLPDVLAAALRQWFELVTADAH